MSMTRVAILTLTVSALIVGCGQQAVEAPNGAKHLILHDDGITKTTAPANAFESIKNYETKLQQKHDAGSFTNILPAPPIPRPSIVESSASLDNDVHALSVTVLYNEWVWQYDWQDTRYGTPFERRVGPQTVSTNVSGSYNIAISAEGTVRLVAVSGTGSITVTAGGSYSATWHTCADFQKKEILRFARYKNFAKYSDGTYKWTGGIADNRLAAHMGDSVTSRISGWSVC